MTGYVHISKRPEATQPAPSASTPAGQALPPDAAKHFARLKFLARQAQTAAALAREARDKAQQLAEEKTRELQKMQARVDALSTGNHSLRTQLTDARAANTGLMSDIADLSAQVAALRQTQTADARGDVEAIITIRGTDLTSNRVDALAVHRALQAAGDSVLYHLHETAEQARQTQAATS